MNGCCLFRGHSSDAFYRVVVNFAGSDNTAWAVTFSNVLNNSDKLFEGEFGIPVWCTSSFTEFPSAGEAFEESGLALTVVFAEFDVVRVDFSVIFTSGEGAG
jgi:hypothetical protein